MTFTEFGPNSRANVPEHNRLRGLDQGNPHPQYLRADTPVTPAQVDSSLPRGVLGYAEITSPAGGYNSTTVSDVGGLSQTVSVATGRVIRVSFNAAVLSSVGGDIIGMFITNDANAIKAESYISSPTNVVATRLVGSVVFSGLTAGTYTWKIRANRATGTGSGTVDAGSTKPAYLLVEDIGAAS